VLSVRNLLKLLCLLGALAVVGPAVAIAAGPSAGDQQYVDPLGGSGGSHHNSTTTTGAPTPAPAPAPVASSSGTTPTATTASATGVTPTATVGTSSNTLPFTGLNVGLAAGVGALLLVAGVGIRQVARRRA
jgi:hypothetical protein